MTRRNRTNNDLQNTTWKTKDLRKMNFIKTRVWQKEKVQKDKQRSTKHTYIHKDRVTRIPLRPGVNSGSPKVVK
jgi:hypothetical protein